MHETTEPRIGQVKPVLMQEKLPIIKPAGDISKGRNSWWRLSPPAADQPLVGK